MLTKKHYLKWIGISTILAGSMAMAVMATVACSSTPTPVSNEGVYNQWATDLSKSTDNFDVQTLNWYKENTASMFIAMRNSNSGAQGTIWNYPNPDPVGDPSGRYFATNIHVVSDALIPSTNNSYTLNGNFEFYSSRNAISYEKMLGVSLYHISTQGRPTGLIGGQWTGDWYNDFVILRTTTPIFPYSNTVNFMDTKDEFDWLVKSSSLPTFYSCGFPALNDAGWPNSSEWVSVKYIWDASKAQSSFRPTTGTAAQYSTDYLSASDKSGLFIGHELNGRLAKSYAFQILLPELNTKGGSSGSLVGVKYNGNLMLVGIYWGGYKFDTNEFLGGIDLFYTASSYQYGRYGMAPSYNNLV